MKKLALVASAIAVALTVNVPQAKVSEAEAASWVLN